MLHSPLGKHSSRSYRARLIILVIFILWMCCTCNLESTCKFTSLLLFMIKAIPYEWYSKISSLIPKLILAFNAIPRPIPALHTFQCTWLTMLPTKKHWMGLGMRQVHVESQFLCMHPLALLPNKTHWYAYCPVAKWLLILTITSICTRQLHIIIYRCYLHARVKTNKELMVHSNLHK